MLVPLLLLALPGEPRLPDRIEMHEGPALEGRVVFEDAQEVVLLQGSRERSIARKKVRSVFSRAANQRELLQRWHDLKPPDDAALDAASWCLRVDLLEEARLIALDVLARNPQNERAHELAGHERRGKEWTVRDGGLRVEWSRLVRQRATWKTSWELESTHCRLRTDLPLNQAVAALFDLENTYQGFYALLGPALRLRELVEPMSAQIHSGARSFPETSSRTAYFDPGSETLFVLAEDGLDRGILVHEAVHQLLYATASGRGRALGAIPAWLDEGLAETLRAAALGAPGRLRLDTTRYDLGAFQAHAGSSDPYDLSRLLTFDSSDFSASTRADLKYAQAHTLVHYLLQGEDGVLRDPFLGFVRGAYAGKGWTTDFKSAMGGKLARLERDWTAYVRRLAAR